MRLPLAGRDADFGGNTRGDGAVFVVHFDLGKKGSGLSRGGGADERHAPLAFFAGDEGHIGLLTVLDAPQRLLRHLQGDGQGPVVDDALDIAAG